MSLIVVGLNHRTAPVELLERMTVAGRARCPRRSTTLARARAPRRGRAALHVQPHRGLRALHAVPPRGVRTSASSSPSRLRRRPRRLRRPPLHVLRRRRGRAPLRRRRRARLDDHRRGRDPRPGARGVAGSPSSEGASGQLLVARVPPRGRVGKRARTETGDRPARGVGRRRPRSRSPSRRLGSLDGRSVLVLGAGEMGAGHRRSRWRAPASARSSSPTARYARAVELASKVGGRADHRSTTSPDALVDVRRAARRRPASTEVLIERGDIEAVMARRDGRAAARRRRRACPATSIPGAGQVPGVTLLDIDDLKRFAEHSLERAPARDRQGPRDHHRRARAVPDRPHRTRGRAARHLAARSAARRSAPPSSSASGPSSTTLDPATRNAVEALTRGIVNKLLHEPTVRAEGRRRHRPRRALRRRARRAVRPAGRPPGRPASE